MLSSLAVGIRSLLLPESCAGCRRPLTEETVSSPLCGACFKALPWSPPAAFKEAISPLRYEGVAKELIAQLKYHGRLSLVPFLGQILTEAVLARLGPDPADAVVPVPLHPVRLRERTFNQAELLARRVAGNLRLPCREDLLVRRRATPPQPGLTRRDRRANVKEAFALAAGPPIRSARLLLVDDVFTTGSTAGACLRLLKGAGAAEATAAAVAHG